MNLCIVSGSVRRIRLWSGAGKHRFALMVIASRGIGGKKRYNQFTVICYGKTAQMVWDRLSEGSYVAVMGVIERRRMKRGTMYTYEVQIEARQIWLPLYPDAADWLQIAFLLAAQEQHEKEDDGQEHAPPTLVGDKGDEKGRKKNARSKRSKGDDPGAEDRGRGETGGESSTPDSGGDG